MKNGLVHKGDGSEPVETDILVKNGRIIGFLKATKKNSGDIIDVKGMAVTPGFIEVNFDAGGRGGLFDDVYSVGLVKKGITTVVGGSNGVSPAPIFAKSAPFLKSAFSYLPNADWQSMREFLSTLEKRGVGVNFGTLTGYATLRSAFTEGYGRDLTMGEIESLGRALSESLKEGALGAAFDFSEPYLNGVSTDEVFKVMNATGRFKSVFAFHLRDENEIVKSMEEILFLSEAHNVNTEIDHFQPMMDVKDKYLEAVSEIEKTASEKNVHFDVFPHPVVMMPVYDLLPRWVKGRSLKELEETIQAPHIRERLLADLDRLNYENLTIAEAPRPLGFLEGKKMADFASSEGLTNGEAVLKLAVLSKMKANIFCGCVDAEALESLLKSDHSMITLSYHHSEMEESPIFGKIISSEKLIEKLTGLPAKKYGIAQRGSLKEGYFADIVVFKDNKPYYVFVNGLTVLEKGLPKPQMAGMVLKNQFEK